MSAFASVLEYPKVLAWAAEYASSSLGRARLLALEPVTEAATIRAWLAEVAELSTLLGERERLPLTGLADLAAMLGEARKDGLLEAEDLLAAAISLRTSRELAVLLTGLDEGRFPRIRALGEDMPTFPELEKRITTAIGRDGTVLDSASPKLPKLRATIVRARQRHRKVLERLLNQPHLAKALQNRKPTLRGERTVLIVKKNFRGMVPGILHGISQTGQTLYVEPAELVDLGNSVAEAIFAERQEVERILRDLTRGLLEVAPDIERLSARCGELDAIHAKAVLAREHAMVVPELREEASLKLIGARHPILLKLADGDADAVVPADIRIGHDFDMLLITGPNTGGKTVALKTVGLLQLMVQSGLPIPASDGSQVGIFHHFYADIGDEQSLQQSLSTFSSHVVRLKQAIAAAERRSLVLLDELGSGTDPKEGAALSRAILEHLVRSGARCLITTHIGELKDFCLAEARAMNASVEFDAETLRPTYRFLLGQPGNSNALSICRRLGIPDSVLERASELLETSDTLHAELVEKMSELAQDAEADREAAARTLEEAELEREAAEKERAAAASRRETVAREFDREAEELGGELRQVLSDDKLHWLEQMPRRWREEVEQLRYRLLTALERSPFEERRKAWAQKLKKGRKTFVISYGKVGTVTRINKGRERLSVNFGGPITVDTDFSDVSWIGTEEIERRA